MRERMSNNRGFTLIELLVALAAGVLVLGAIYSLYASFLRHSTGQDSLIEVQQEARIAVDRLAKEVRVAGCYFVQSRIRTATATTFDFETDLDPDPLQAPWRIRYALAGGELQRSAAQWNGAAFPAYSGTGLNQAIASHISALAFAYFDATGAPIANPSTQALRDAIRRVDISLTAQTDKPNPATNKIDSIALNTSVYLRCDANQSSDTTPCALPTNLAVTDGGICGRLNLTWTASVDPDAVGYKVYYRPTGAANYTGLIDVPGGATAAFTIDGLDDSVPYTIAMRCLDSAGNLNVDVNGNPIFTPVVNATPTDTTPPEIATAVDATASVNATPGSVTVSWTASVAVDVGGYNIYRSDDDGVTYSYVGETDSNNTSYQDLTVTNCFAQPYRYRVTSWDCAGATNMIPHSDPSVVALTVFGDGGGTVVDQPQPGVTDTNPQETTSPSDPGNFNALPGANEIYVSYDAPSTDFDGTLSTDLLGVRILRKDDGGSGLGPLFPTDKNDAGATGPNGQKDYTPQTSGQTYVVTDCGSSLCAHDINIGWTYYYRAFAYDGCANFSDGAVSQATAKPCGDAQFGGPPDAPTNLAATVCGGATLTWDAPTTYAGGTAFMPVGTDDLIGYRIYRSTTNNFASATLLNSGGPVTSTTYSNSGLTPGLSFYYWVKAEDCAPQEGPFVGSIPVKPTDIEWDHGVTATTFGTSGISGSQHNVVNFGLKNPGLSDVIIDTATLTWTKTTANIKKVSLKQIDGSINVLWDDTSLPLTSSGFTIDFASFEPNDVLRTLTHESLLNELIIEFRESDNGGFIDMRGDTINVTLGYTNSVAGSSCDSTIFSVPVPLGPTISNSTQDRPSAPTTSNLNVGNVVVAAGTQDNAFVWTDHSVTVQSTITPELGTTLVEEKLYYQTTGKTTTTPPATDYSIAPSGWTELTMCNVASTNVYQTADTLGCTTTNIPFADTVGKRVWYYIVAVDDNTNADIQPEPSTGIYTYDHESKFGIDLTVLRSGPGGEDVTVEVALTDENGVSVSGAAITVSILDAGGGATESGTLTEDPAIAGAYTYTATPALFHDLTIDVKIGVSSDTFTAAKCGTTGIDKVTTSTPVTCN